MIQRQPADEAIAGRHARGAAHGANVGEQVVVAQHHALGIARAAGGVLEHRRVAAGSAGRNARLARATQLVDADDSLQMRQLRAQDLADELRFGHRHEHPGRAVREDRRTAANVFLDFRPAHRRIHRHGQGADEHRAEERLEEGAACGQHERYRIIVADAERGKTARRLLSVSPQRARTRWFQAARRLRAA